MEVLRVKIEVPENPDAVWLGYLLLKEESKRLLIEQECSNLMPDIHKYK